MSLLYFGLLGVQHRGQESSGVILSNGETELEHLHFRRLSTGKNSVDSLFAKKNIPIGEKFSLAIGHNRYSTSGSVKNINNIQPLLAKTRYGTLGIAHNGNLPQSLAMRDELSKQGDIFFSDSDTEIILKLIARSKRSSLVEAIIETLEVIGGSYSLLFITKDEIIAARDPYGIRPLCLGQFDHGYMIASEQSSFNKNLGVNFVREIERGEILVINNEGLKTHKMNIPQNAAHCIFELIYFARPDSFQFDHSVADFRMQTGKLYSRRHSSLGYLDTWLVAHELTHQWFGDHITCASWQDIWVNEGFASYGEYIFGQYTNGQIAADINMNYCHIKAKLEPFRSVYIPFSEAWDEGRIFNGNLSYKKGSAIIHMLRYLCNTDSLFFVALKQMQSQYADSVLTGEDVKNVFESVNGKSFDDFFNQYYYGEGFPIYKIVWQQDSSVMGFSDLKVKLEHHGSSANNSLFTIPVELKIKTSTDSLITAINPTQNVQTFNINMNNKKVTEIVFDPKNWVLDSLLSITQKCILSRNRLSFLYKIVWLYKSYFFEFCQFLKKHDL